MDYFLQVILPALISSGIVGIIMGGILNGRQAKRDKEHEIHTQTMQQSFDTALANNQKQHEKYLQKITHDFKQAQEEDRQKSAQYLQIDNFYRNVSTEKIEGLLDEWSNMLLSMGDGTNDDDPAKLQSLIKRTVLYGSEDTIYRLMIFQQFNYLYYGTDKLVKEQMKRSYKKNITSMLYFMLADVVSSLKYDFTGVKITPECFIAMKISDFYTMSFEGFEQAKSKVERFVEDLTSGVYAELSKPSSGYYSKQL